MDEEKRVGEYFRKEFMSGGQEVNMRICKTKVEELQWRLMG